MSIYQIEPYAGFLLSRKLSTTAKAYSPSLNAFRQFLEKRKLKPEVAGVQDLFSFGIWIKGNEKWGASSKCLCSKVVRSFYEHLLDLEMVESNPALILKKFKFTWAPINPRPMEIEDAKWLLKSLRWDTYNNIRFSCAVFLGLYHGLRSAEVAGIKWENVDFQNEEFSFTGKCGKPATVKMLPAVKLAFRQMRMAAEKKWGRLFLDDMTYVFRGRGGDKPWNVWAFHAKVRTHCGKLGLKFTFHQLRHTLGTMMNMSGADMYSIRDTLRHSSVQVTERYVKVAAERRQESLEKALELLEN